MEKILVYPFSLENVAYIKYGKLIKGGVVSSVVSPRGWGLDGLKIEGTDICVTSDYEGELKNCTAVWLLEDTKKYMPESLLISKVIEAVHNHKTIWISKNYCSMDVLERIVPRQNLHYIEKNNVDCNFEADFYFRLIEINVPVIFVLGSSENTNKFETQLALYEKFSQMGYDVVAINPKSDAGIMEMYSIPEFMWENTMDISEKIFTFNHYVKKIEIQEKPELILIEIPGGVLPYSYNKYNSFGSMMYMISFAVKADAAVFCTLYDEYEKEYFDKIIKKIWEKFDVDIKYFHISNYMLDRDTGRELILTSMLKLDCSYVEKKVADLDVTNIYNIWKDEEVERLCNDIIEQLQ